jgi:tetratricopeptide (TPR) repeat protein
VAITLNNLAAAYGAEGRVVEAEQLIQRALEINLHTYGNLHTEVAANLKNLAVSYTFQHRFMDALPLFRRAAYILDHQTGGQTPNAVAGTNPYDVEIGLGFMYVELYRHARAVPVLRKVIGSTLSASLPKYFGWLILLTVSNLFYGAFLAWSPKADAGAHLVGVFILLAYAYPAFFTVQVLIGLVQRRYLELLITVLISQIICVLNKMGISFVSVTLALLEKRPQPVPLEVAVALYRLGRLQDELGEAPKARSFYQRALQIWETCLSHGHPGMAESLNGLAELEFMEGKYADALPLFKRALEIAQTSLPAGEPLVEQCANSIRACQIALKWVVGSDLPSPERVKETDSASG